MKRKEWPNFNDKLINKVIDVIKSGKVNYTNGKYGKLFEKKFSKYVGNKYSVAICNGTLALEVAIKALNLEKNSEILVTARSFFASASCIVNTGHIPKFLDVDLYTQNINIEEIKKNLSNKTKAIICVHLAGLPCPMEEIIQLSKKKKIKVIEDCSQAHGASINNKQVGSFGDVATWSFCTDKIISTLGEGGMLSTNNKNIYNFSSKYINHGSDIKYKSNQEKFIYNKNMFGSNYRLTEIQSVAGIEQLKDLKKTQILRENIARDFKNVIDEFNDKLFYYYPKKNIKSAWYRFYFFLKKKNNKIRFDLIRTLKKKNIKVFSGSCPEIYLEKAFKKLENFEFKRLHNCKILGETSIALDVNHTLKIDEHKFNLIKLRKSLKKILYK